MGTREVRILDLFSGAGGMSLGWLKALGMGAELVAAVDEDPTLEEVYSWNLPRVRFAQHKFEPNELDPIPQIVGKLGLQAGDVDVLLAGPPCQSLSSAGKREDHPDNRLALRVCDVAAFLKPRVVVMENVPEFSYIHDGRLLGRVRVRLKEAGYLTNPVTLNATAFGVPQVRMRCIVLAVRRELADDQIRTYPTLLRPLSTHRAVASHREVIRSRVADHGQPELPIADELPPPPTVSDALADLPSLGAGEGGEIGVLTSVANSDYQAALRSGTALFNHVAVNHSPEIISAIAKLGPGETPQRMAEHPLRKKDYFRSAYARLHPDCVAPTMTTQTHNPGSGRFTHYSDDRVLTVREVARIQSFPDWFRFFGHQETQRRHVGNAVPPLLSEAIARSLLRFVLPGARG